MEALNTPDGRVSLSLTLEEATVVHELIASAEFADDFETIELPHPVDQKVMSDIQQALAPLIPGLGTDQYQAAVDRAHRSVAPGPFGKQS